MEYKKGLIMEGGAMRGMFTCGVIDVFMENGITFDGAIGVSAGAAFGCNIQSRQIGRPYRYNLRFCKEKKYCSFYSLFTTGDLYGVDYCYHVIPDELDVFDRKAFKENPMDFYLVATDINTGKAVYHKCTDGQANDMQWIRASASMPLFSRIVKIGDLELLDGGIGDSIPVKYFEHKGFNRNVCITTQPKEYRKEKNKMMPLVKIALRNYPNMVKAMGNRHIRYNKTVEYIIEKENDGELFVIRPPKALCIGAKETDRSEITRVYNIGRETALQRLSDLKEYLGE